MVSTFTAAVTAQVWGLHGLALYGLVGLLAFGEGAGAGEHPAVDPVETAAPVTRVRAVVTR